MTPPTQETPQAARTSPFAWVVGAVLLGCVFVTGLQPIRSPDYWHHAASGRFVAQNGGPAEHDVFSHTARGRRWVQFEWLAQWLVYMGHRRIGPAGLIFLKAFLIAEGYLLLWLAARRRAGDAIAALVVMGVAAAGVPRSFVRPEMFSWLIFGAFVLALESARRGRLRHLLILPPLMVLWVNLHGAWAGGLALVGGVAAGETLKAFLPKLGKDEPHVLRHRAIGFCVAAVACVAATLVNPYGFEMWHVPLNLMRSHAVAQHILEWRASGLSALLDPKYLVIWIGAVCFLGTLRRVDVTDLIVALGFGFLAWRAQRQIVLLGFVSAPIFGAHVRGLLRGLPKSARSMRAWIPRFATLVVLFATLWLAMGPPIFGRVGVRVMTEGNVPVRAAQFLGRHHLEGNLFNTYRFGNYFMWRRYPMNPVFIDGRVDMYGDEILAEYGRLLAGPQDWEAAFDRRRIELAVIEMPTTGRPAPGIIGRLMASRRWHLVHWDDVSLVFLRERRLPRVGVMDLLPGGRLLRLITRASMALFDFPRQHLPGGLRAYTIRPDTFTPEGASREHVVAAVAEFQRILADDPDCLTAHSRIAAAYEALREAPRALEHLRVVANARPESGVARYNLGRCLVMLGRYEEGEGHLRAALRHGGPAASVHLNLGNARFLQGDYAGAAGHFERTVALRPTDWRTRLSLAAAYEKMGRIEKAIAQAEAVLARDPSNMPARRQLERLRQQR